MKYNGKNVIGTHISIYFDEYLHQDVAIYLFIHFADFNIDLCEGAIELSILADYYRREIAAYDIQTARCDLYGQVRINKFCV